MEINLDVDLSDIKRLYLYIEEKIKCPHCESINQFSSEDYISYHKNGSEQDVYNENECIQCKEIFRVTIKFKHTLKGKLNVYKN